MDHSRDKTIILFIRLIFPSLGYNKKKTTTIICACICVCECEQRQAKVVYSSFSQHLDSSL